MPGRSRQSYGRRNDELFAFGVPPGFLAEVREDRRTLVFAVAAAVLLHLVLFAIHFPRFESSVRQIASGRKVYVIQQVRFREPEPAQAPSQPKRKVKKVPIPDPTPDLPEPLRTEEYVAPDIEVEGLGDLPGSFIPNAPPGPGSSFPGTLEVAGDVVAPVKIFGPQPGYTEPARRARIQGVVLLRAVIDETGRVAYVQILKGLPEGLTEATVETVRTWQFRPATLNGKPVPVYYNFTVNFRLQ